MTEKERMFELQKAAIAARKAKQRYILYGPKTSTWSATHPAYYRPSDRQEK